jgi:hypothetical protein
VRQRIARNLNSGRVHSLTDPWKKAATGRGRGSVVIAGRHAHGTSDLSARMSSTPSVYSFQWSRIG